MNLNIHISLCLICLMMAWGCNSSKNQQKQDTGKTTNSDTIAMDEHSLPPPPKPGPAPGQARIRAQLIDVQTAAPGGQDITTVTFIIKNIDAYGPSTPPLAVDDSVTVKAADFADEQGEISAGKIVTAVISYQQAILGYDEAPRWSLVEIEQE